MAQFLHLGALCVLYAMPIGLLGCLTHSLFRKRQQTAPSRRQAALAALTWWYTAFVFFAILGTRQDSYTAAFNLRPLREITDAFETLDRRNLFLIFANLLLFVPLAALWSARLQNRKSFRLVPLLCAVFSILLELAQLALHRGIADVDDILLNTSGALLGWCLYKRVIQKQRERTDSLCLFPAALLCLGLFVCILQPYGKTQYDATQSNHAESVGSVEYSGSFTFSALPASADLYKVQIEQDAQAKATIDALFSTLHETIEENIPYDKLYVCYPPNRRFCVWYDYGAQYFNLNNYNDTTLSQIDPADSDAVLTLLRAAGVLLPDGLTCEKAPDGGCVISASFLPYQGEIYNGAITVSADKDQLECIHYEIKRLQFYKTVPLLTEAELTKKLAGGAFIYSGSVRRLVCNSISLFYLQDSRGYYRPYYKISASLDGRPRTIMISACKT